ncbi:MAG: hypothetical protein KC609_01545 [Myxococcales bacterium]|nr:hypothetical protein [Myxococcales bacterium]
MRPLLITLRLACLVCLSLLQACLPSPGKQANDTTSTADTTTPDLSSLPDDCKNAVGSYCIVGTFRSFLTGALLTNVGENYEAVLIADRTKFFPDSDPVCAAYLADQATYVDFQSNCALGDPVDVKDGKFVARGLSWTDTSINPQIYFYYHKGITLDRIHYAPVLQPLYAFRHVKEHLVDVTIYMISIDEITDMYSGYPNANLTMAEGAGLARIDGVDDLAGWMVKLSSGLPLSTRPCIDIACTTFGDENEGTNRNGLIAIPNPDVAAGHPFEFKLSHLTLSPDTFAPQTFGMRPNMVTLTVWRPKGK